jgi:hypothetical protein
MRSPAYDGKLYSYDANLVPSAGYKRNGIEKMALHRTRGVLLIPA